MKCEFCGAEIRQRVEVGGTQYSCVNAECGHGWFDDRVHGPNIVKRALAFGPWLELERKKRGASEERLWVQELDYIESIALAVVQMAEALDKIERLDIRLAANSDYDKGLMVAHSCTATIARAVLEKLGVRTSGSNSI